MDILSLLDRKDWIILLLGVLIPIVLAIIVNLIKLCFQYRNASADLRTKIQGTWYSAEFDHKNTEPIESRNTFLKVKLKRKFGNKIIIKSIEDIDENGNKKYPTGWVVEGKLVRGNLLGEWYSTVPATIRYGNVFLKFLDNKIAVGYWIGESLFPRPMYGYWIMSKNLEEIQNLSKTVLSEYDFHAYDVAYLIENINKKKIPIETVKI